MSRRSSRGLILLSAASLGLVAAALTLHSVGCSNDDKTDEAIRGDSGICPEPGPCDDIVAGCENGTNTYAPLKDGTECNLGKNKGICEKATCILACASNPSDCACSIEGGVVVGCPVPTECLKWDCVSEHCKSTPQTDQPLQAQSAGDCKTNICSAEGGTTDEPEPTDTPAAMDDCHVGACDGTTTKQNFQELGKPCALAAGQTGICNGVGTCVICLEGKNPTNGCAPGEVCYKGMGGQLACTHCTNGKQDPGEEVGVDCGGVCAQNKAGATPTCKLGTACSAGTDCLSGNCVDGVCCGTACTDPCKSCSEGISGPGLCSDVPTGTMDSTCIAGQVCVVGTGGKCLGTAGAMCSNDSQCMSESCPFFMCVPGVAGKPCASDKDCANGSTCKLTNHICG